jgi:hypothetical protein
MNIRKVIQKLDKFTIALKENLRWGIIWILHKMTKELALQARITVDISENHNHHRNRSILQFKKNEIVVDYWNYMSLHLFPDISVQTYDHGLAVNHYICFFISPCAYYYHCFS